MFINASRFSVNLQPPGLNPTPLSQVRTNCEYDTGSPRGRWPNKRRWCGLCNGCLVLDNCGLCSVCINPNTHQVCKLRQCSHLQHKGSKKPRKKTSLHDTPPDMRLRPHNVSNSNMMQIQSYEQPAPNLSTQFEPMARHFNVLEAQRNIANNSGFGIQHGLVNHGAPNVSRALHDNERNYPNIHPGRSSDNWINPFCVPYQNSRMFPSHQGPLIVPPPDNLNVRSFPNSHGPSNVSLLQECGPNTSATLISSSSLVKHISTKPSRSNTSVSCMIEIALDRLKSHGEIDAELPPLIPTPFYGAQTSTLFGVSKPTSTKLWSPSSTVQYPTVYGIPSYTPQSPILYGTPP
uniref:CXXC-type domain-containing protein n=1 Tax=Timema shepardi TaxID=629360 RepID=A0A7R9B5N1_TIMSH|nr:unnamed protein product [Timema shepardi]